jgi:hypothetical protein
VSAAGGDAAATCSSAPGSTVRFKLRDSGAAIEFSTVSSCTAGQTGARSYEVTSSELGTTTSAGGATVLVYRSLNITDDTASGKAGRIVVECSRWTLRVVVSGSGPRAVALGFTIVDGDGNVVWTSGLGKLVEGSAGLEPQP